MKRGGLVKNDSRMREGGLANCNFLWRSAVENVVRSISCFFGFLSGKKIVGWESTTLWANSSPLAPLWNSVLSQSVEWKMYKWSRTVFQGPRAIYHCPMSKHSWQIPKLLRQLHRKFISRFVRSVSQVLHLFLGPRVGPVSRHRILYLQHT